jgi:hypothetical protein
VRGGAGDAAPAAALGLGSDWCLTYPPWVTVTTISSGAIMS